MIMKKIINYYKRLTFFQGAACALGVTSVVGIAATVSPLNIFSPGTTISSSQINDNFNKLKVAIESTSSQTYMGTHDASTLTDPVGGTTTGEYYIISVPGTINAVSYNIGDWIMFDGTSWGRVPSSSLITSVFGRTGAIAAAEGDYDLHKLTDVDLSTTPSAGQALVYDGVKWVAQTINIPPSSVTAASLTSSAVNSVAIAPSAVTSSHIMDGTIVNADIAAGASIDFSKINLPMGTITYDRLMIANGEIPYTKIGGLPAPTDILGPISNGDITHAPSSDAVFDALATKINLTGGTLSVGTINGVPTPVASDDIVNKAYVDASQPWSHNGSDLYLGSGNLGIGTTTPNYKLQVFGDVFASPSFISDAFTTAISPALKSSSSMTTGIFFPMAHTLAITTNGVERMIVDPSGFVGIGTSSPTVALEVNGDIKNVGHIKTQFIRTITAGGPSSPNISNFTDPATGIFYPGAGIIGFTQNGTESMRIDSTGSVGIGILTPTYALHVNGIVAGTSAYMNASDARYKKHISSIENALDKLLSIDGVSYEFKTEEYPELKFSNHREMGVIAQKVETVFPEAVSKDKKGFRSVAYSMLIAPIIESIRELDQRTKKIEDLENENKLLKDYLCAKDQNAPFCE